MTRIVLPKVGDLAQFGRDRGTGTVLPSTDLRRGDVYFHTGLGCLMTWTGVAWRQVDVPIVADAAALTAISTSYSAVLYDGFSAWVADIDSEAWWNGASWDGLWTTFTPTWFTESGGGAPSVGNGVLTGRYLKVGRTVDVDVHLALGSTTSGGTGGWAFGLPFTARAGREHELAVKLWCGSGNYQGVAYITTGTAVARPLAPLATGSNQVVLDQVRNASTGGAAGTGVPYVAGNYSFGAGHNLTMFGRYESA